MGLSYSGIRRISVVQQRLSAGNRLNPRHAPELSQVVRNADGFPQQGHDRRSLRAPEAVLANAPGNTEAMRPCRLPSGGVGQSQDAATGRGNPSELPARMRSIGDLAKTEPSVRVLAGAEDVLRKAVAKRAAIAAGCLGPRANRSAFKVAAEGGNGRLSGLPATGPKERPCARGIGPPHNSRSHRTDEAEETYKRLADSRPRSK